MARIAAAPFSTPFSTPLVGPAGFDVSAIWANLESTARMTLYQSLHTGHWLTDAVAYSAALYLLGAGVQLAARARTVLASLTDPSILWRLVLRLVKAAMRRLRVRWAWLDDAVDKRVFTVVVALITENRELNDVLYDALLDFCNVQIEQSTSERRARGIFSDAGSERHEYVMIKDKHAEPTPQVPMSRAETFVFQGITYEYVHTSPTITIHADRDRQRANHTITLTCELPKTAAAHDPFRALVDAATAAAREKQQRVKWQQKVFRNRGEEWIEATRPSPRRIETVILSGSLRDDIVRNLDDFLGRKELYEDTGSAYTRRYLFHGDPRTGKTSMIRALATHKKRHIHYLQLSGVASDDQLTTLLSPAKIDYATTIVIIEDVDCASPAVLDRALQDELVREKNATAITRQAKSPSLSEWDAVAQAGHALPSDAKTADANPAGITLSGLLNVLDGVLQCQGQVMIMTTNYRDRLDKALVAPGRIHKHFHFQLADRQQFKRMFAMFFKQELGDEEAEHFVEGVLQPAEISNTFLTFMDDPRAAVRSVLAACQEGAVKP